MARKLSGSVGNKPFIYFWSYDNPRDRNYRQPALKLGRVAEVDRIAPKTTLRLERRPGVTFSQLCATAAETLDIRKGSGVLFSAHTGRAYVIDNRGNRRGEWVLQ